MRDWLSIWLKVFLEPSEKTFLDIAEDPKLRPNIAFIWIFVSAAVVAGCAGFGFNSMIVGAVLTVSFAASIYIKNGIVKFYGGTDSFVKLACVFAAIYAPLAIVASILVLISNTPIAKPYAIGVFILAFLYDLVLQITAIKALSRLVWSKAALCILIPLTGVAIALYLFQSLQPFH